MTKKTNTTEAAGPATVEDLQNLHTLLTNALTARIKSGEATAAELNVARQLMKDSGVVASAVPGSPIAKLADAAGVVLPFLAPRADAKVAAAPLVPAIKSDDENAARAFESFAD